MNVYKMLLFCFSLYTVASDNVLDVLPGLLNAITPGSFLAKVFKPADIGQTAEALIVATSKRLPEIYYPWWQGIKIGVALRHIYPKVFTWLGIPM